MTKESKNLVEIICPVCNSKKQLKIPESIINQAKHLTTISIQKGMLCHHHFQVFIDKNFRIRGYQKIDFEISPNKRVDMNFKDQNKNSSKNTEDHLCENLIMEGNYLEYQPIDLNSNNLNIVPKRSDIAKLRKNLSHKEIYELFWEFIDENNREFRELIIKDKRRKTLQHALNLIEH